MSMLAMLELEGVEGECAVNGYEKWVELESWNMDVTNPSSMGTGSGGGRGQAEFGPFSIGMKEGPHVATILDKIAMSKHHTSAKLVHARLDGNAVIPFVEFQFPEGIIWEHISLAGHGDGAPGVTGAFGYGKIIATFHVQNDDGSQGAPHEVSYDQRKVAA